MYFDTVAAAHIHTLPKFAFTSGASFNARIRALVDDARDEGIQGLESINSVDDWTSYYHLSSSRAAMLEPLWTRISSPVLELGCGLGALTTHLGERGLQVAALDSSPARREITQARCAHLPSVAVTDPGLLETALGMFNTVMLVGVLEYSPQQHPEESAVDAFLSVLGQARSALAEGGKLVLAIENRLGTKYFAGAGEDHNNIAYYGLESRYSGTDAVTFGHRELRDLLTFAGFMHQNWYYPFPDYKFPVCILSERAADPDGPFDPRPLLRWANRLATHSTRQVFDTGRSFDSVWRNGLLGSLSNSFLIECSPTSLPTEHDLAWIMPPPGFAKQHTLSWVVEDSPSSAESDLTKRAWRLRNQSGTGRDAPPAALLESDSHLSHLQDLLTSSRTCDSDAELARGLASWLDQWLDALASEANVPRGALAQPCRLETRLLGATPGNLFHGRGALSFGPLPDLAPLGGDLGVVDAHWIIYRGLLHAALQLRGSRRGLESSRSVGQLIRTIGANLLPREGTMEMAEVRAREAALLRRFTSYARDVDLNRVESLPMCEAGDDD